MSSSTRPDLRRAAITEILEHLERCPGPLRVTVVRSGGARVTFHVPAAEAPAAAPHPHVEQAPPVQDAPAAPAPAPSRRDARGLWDVRNALADADPARLTLDQLQAVLLRSGIEWSLRSLSRFLADLQQRGEVDNQQRNGDRGSGYGFCYAPLATRVSS